MDVSVGYLHFVGELCRLRNINPSKATGPDTIAGRVLKENIDICTDILTLLFTKSLETGKVPSDWNHANELFV
jgi:hypothetical protein